LNSENKKGEESYKGYNITFEKKKKKKKKKKIKKKKKNRK